MTEIIVGVVAGVVTAAILNLLKAVWESKITPYMAEVRYQGVRVDGRWEAVDDNPATSTHAESRLFLVQSAHKLNGTYTFSLRSPQRSFTLEFMVTGHMWEGYLTLTCLPKDRRITSYAIALLKLHGGGTALIGQYCFRNVENDVVNAIPISLFRQNPESPGDLREVGRKPAPAAQPEPVEQPAHIVQPAPVDTSGEAGRS